MGSVNQLLLNTFFSGDPEHRRARGLDIGIGVGCGYLDEAVRRNALYKGGFWHTP
jgi:23S rRNA A1618 N6-methylase RlmF